MDRNKDKEEIITLEMDENKIKFITNMQRHSKVAQTFWEKSSTATDPNSRAFFGLVSFVARNHVESLHYLQFSIDTLLELSKGLMDTNTKLGELEKILRESQTITAEEFSALYETIDQIKTRNLTALENLSKRLADAGQETDKDEKQRKLEEELLDNALRSR